jgi:hypothetical protein
VSLFAKTTPSVFSVEHMTSLEPYLKGSTEKDDQEIAYQVVLIYRTLLAQAQLTFQPEFLTRAMTTIATSMTSVSLKVIRITCCADDSISKKASRRSVLLREC